MSVEVNENLIEGLKRELSVRIPAAELDTRLSTRLEEMRTRVNLKGFRPGKVPESHLRRLYGKAAMAEIVQDMVSETSQKAIVDRGEKAATQPAIKMTEDEAEASEILAGKADLTYTMEYEILPDFELSDFKGLTIERPVAEVTDEAVEERLVRIAEGNRTYHDVERAAAEGDRVTLSYVGKMDGKVFEGGTGSETTIVIGSGQFIPGFEAALTGLAAGDAKTIDVTFPKTYPSKELAGKAATFDVEVKSVAEPDETAIDEAFATRLGVDSLEKLRETVKAQAESAHAQASRQKIKRQVLDALDEKYAFPLPEMLVNQEFENIWRQVMHDIEHHGRTFEEEGTTEEEARKEYRGIAERRVRLGLVLSRIGEDAEVEVTEDEIQRALYNQVSRYPGQERSIIEHYRNNPDALQALRAPIFEDKVIDYILEFADVTEKTVSPEELLASDDDDEEAGEHDHDHGH